MTLVEEGRAALAAQAVESVCDAGDPGSISGSGRSPGERNGTSLQYSCLENSMDGGAWWATVNGVTRVRQEFVTKPPPQKIKFCLISCEGIAVKVLNAKP